MSNSDPTDQRENERRETFRFLLHQLNCGSREQNIERRVSTSRQVAQSRQAGGSHRRTFVIFAVRLSWPWADDEEDEDSLTSNNKQFENRTKNFAAM